MSFLFLFFWQISIFKKILFWVYLWQLKEYHLGRFIDYFRTEKGKKIFKNFFFLSKIFLLPFSFKFFYPLFFLYFLETLKFFLDFFKKNLFFPKFTFKATFLIFFSLLFSLFFCFLFFEKIYFLLIFDILNSAIFSGIVLTFQPLSFLYKLWLIKMATKKREKFKDLIVIGITGSYGKTSTKEFLATILEGKFPGRVLKTKLHQNSEVAISKTILKELNENHKFFIVEMGAYNKGGIEILAKISKPKIGILTGVNEQHLALFGSMENLISGEGGRELILNLPKEGLAIFNGENEILKKIYKETKIKKKIVGILKKDYDFFAANIKVKKDVLFFQVFSKDGDFGNFNLNLVGAQNIENLLLAIACAKQLGMSLKEISKFSKKISQEQSGVKILKSKMGFDLIDATFSANPNSVISHLEHLKLWKGKKAILMPCLIELGKAAKKIHFEIGRKIGQICDLAIIVTKDYFKEIEKGAQGKVLFLENPKEIFEKIKSFSQGDVILLEGRLPQKIISFFREN